MVDMGCPCYRMFMPKQPLSVTLEASNILWLRGRATAGKRRSLSEALDDVVTAARTGGHGADAPRSVVGTIDISAADPALDHADSYLRAEFESSLRRPTLVREASPDYGPAAAPRPKKTPKARRG